jgi:LCP family protein required for cell wall assembly
MERGSRRWKILGWISTGVAAVVVVSAVAVYAVVRTRLSGITHVAQIDTRNRPPQYGDALNILLIGSDTRQGKHNRAAGGRYGCNCSDTIMLAHISPGHGRVTVLSIPRDTVVPLFACSPWGTLPGQQADPYAVERINATLANGGPECVRSTVEQETGIFISNFVQLDFVGFEKVVNDVGGVNVCLPFAIDNTVTASGGTGLRLSAGHHHLGGWLALKFWRTRENIADGSDIARIARDQYVMAQIVKGVLHSGMLTSPSKLYKVIGDIAGAMTTDASNGQLFNIASSMSGISLSKVQFLTAPWVTYPADPNEVEFAQPQADAVFWALAHDAELPKAAKGPGRSGAPTPEGTATPASTPSPGATGAGSGGTGTVVGNESQPTAPPVIQVEILNGSSGVSQVTKAQAALTTRGFDVIGTGDAASFGYRKTVIEYSAPGDLAAANTLAQQFSSSKIKRVAGITPGTVTVILGSSFTALAPPQPTSQASMNNLVGAYGGITADIKCRNSAFYGVYDPTPAPTPTPSGSPSPSPSASGGSGGGSSACAC